jgi:hypothetical protein
MQRKQKKKKQEIKKRVEKQRELNENARKGEREGGSAVDAEHSVVSDGRRGAGGKREISTATESKASPVGKRFQPYIQMCGGDRRTVVARLEITSQGLQCHVFVLRGEGTCVSARTSLLDRHSNSEENVEAEIKTRRKKKYKCEE